MRYNAGMMDNLTPPAPSSSIGTLAEKSLHAALKRWYTEPGDRLEAPLTVTVAGRVRRYHIDLLRDDPAGPLLIEIQTRSFTAIRDKLRALTTAHRVRLVYPVAAERWLVDCDADGHTQRRRRSPRRGRVEDVFTELVRMPDLPLSPRFSLEVLLIRDEEIRHADGRGSWRRGRRSIHDRRLLAVMAARAFLTVADYTALMPEALPAPFTVRELASAARLSPALAGKMAYCLWKMGALARVGAQGRAHLYARVEN